MIIGRKEVYKDVLSIPKGECGAFAIKHRVIKAGTPINRVSARTMIMAGHSAPPVTYGEATRWHELQENGGTWMTDLPIEQFQTDAEVKGVRRGTVLVGGLGLGYVTTCLALRPQVKLVVVVEKSPEVIKLVAGHLLTGDGRAQAKVEVVNADLFDYLSKMPQGKSPWSFDHAYYDIWTSDSEGTFFQTVVPLLRLSVGRVKSQPICWNEGVMRGQLFNSLHSRATYAAAVMKGTWKYSDVGYDIDALCEEKSPWVAWAAPFFRWYRRVKPEQAQLDEMAARYAGAYGRSFFPTYWELVAGEQVPHVSFAKEGE